MPQRRHLTENERQRALGYLLAGRTQRQVAKELNVNQSVIGRLWQLYLDTGDVQRRPGQGRLRVTTDAQDGHLSLMARRRRFDSAVTLHKGILNRRMFTGSLLKPSGTDFMPRTCGLENLLCVRL